MNLWAHRPPAPLAGAHGLQSKDVFTETGSKVHAAILQAATCYCARLSSDSSPTDHCGVACGVSFTVKLWAGPNDDKHLLHWTGADPRVQQLVVSKN